MSYLSSRNTFLSGSSAKLFFTFTYLVVLMESETLVQATETIDTQTVQSFLTNHCLDCHSGPNPSGEFSVEKLELELPSAAVTPWDSKPWERILRRLRAGQMPPPDASRPIQSELDVATKEIDKWLANSSLEHPFAGRPDSLRRLTRTEYQNVIRDLLALEIDATALLPKDESSHGFDNITVGELSPTLLNRYLTSAQTISRIALGGVGIGPMGINVRIPADRTQETHVDGLPLGTRGGVLIEHTFPRDGTYEFQLRLTRDRDEKVEGLTREHALDLLIDREPKHRFAIKPPPNPEDFTLVDAHLKIRLELTAGRHSVGVAFANSGGSLIETKRQPFDVAYNRHRHPRINPALFELAIVGPFDSKSSGDSQSRQTIYGDDAIDQANPTESAKRILRRLARLAFRRPVADQDLESAIWFFEEAFRVGGLDAGMEAALTSLLVNPNFLFRIESQPSDIRAHSPYSITNLELASRLSFFLWSSNPDDRLLTLAENGTLRQPKILDAEIDRMLKDARSHSLVSNFASQWLYLRNLDSITPDLRLYPDFDDNLRQAFRRETELHFQDIIANDRNVLGLIRSDFTFLNQRLATHYGIPHVLGSHFRKVELPTSSDRGGILRHGSILTVTSYATRTSPTIRGNWILQNIIGTPPPPPPPNVPALKEKQNTASQSLRERLAMHRSDAACASCHNLMDPVGFSLDNYDAVGRWRQFDDSEPLDTAGVMPDGSRVHDVRSLEDSIMNRPKVFVGTMIEKLLTFALGRGVEHRDGPAIREIVEYASECDFRFSAIVKGIVLSKPFLMRDAE
ncbi:MAG: DUF1592 domain-containing protein [Planctomycetota bacterium]|nr:DUF1592 domain-containing protein [Planctomycetota bacterium]